MTTVGLKQAAQLVVDLEDTGPGLAPEDRDKVFTPFFTTRHGRLRAGPVHRLRDRPRPPGTDRVRRTRQGLGGAHCRVTFRSIDPRNGRIMNSKTLLVVDDEAAMRRNVRDLLSGPALQVLEAEDGRAGPRPCWRPTHVDVVLLDIHMPGIDGIETLARIKERWPRPAGHPVHRLRHQRAGHRGHEEGRLRLSREALRRRRTCNWSSTGPWSTPGCSRRSIPCGLGADERDCRPAGRQPHHRARPGACRRSSSRSVRSPAARPRSSSRARAAPARN